MQSWIKWDQIEWEIVNENISRKVVIREKIMMVMYKFKPNVVWPEEKHEAEQGGYIIDGKIILRLPDEKKEVLLSKGDGYLIGSNMSHSWETLDEDVIFIDIFSPPRKELIKNKFAPYAKNRS
ncbi:MAG: hypothetical protein DRG20_02150 [Deltaproteobacteria bacterium]|nr:cupin domain-containing protein [Deltaproteobacteria bacterium]RLA91183.1 MAG: hypothetical protein DRG20_02150 [Deltaproteobacteria bacterium]